MLTNKKLTLKELETVFKTIKKNKACGFGD